MILLLSLVTSAKDYFEIVHKLIQVPLTSATNQHYSITDYTEFGSLISYSILTIKHFFTELFNLNWLQNLWSLPIIVPDIASAMISEISVLDGYFHNALTFLETPLSYGKQNYTIYGLERLLIGLINSFFLFLPTSAAHIIMLRRFVFQGIEAGYIAGFGIIAGNLLWLASIIFGWRFFVIPWLSLDILRYLLGFVILIKYMWHASHQAQLESSTLTNLSKSKIFLVTFLLALTEQTNLYPFVTNMSIGAESTLLETFPVDNLTQFIFIHSAYLLGIFAGSLSLLHFTCWLWENPIYKMYLWFISNSNFPINLPKIPKQNYYKYLNFIFLYLTMLCTISSIPYYGLDYTLTNPLGFLSDDLALTKLNKKTNQPEFPELSFLNTQASDRNTRDSRGRHGRRERWKDRLIKYRGMDTSLYEQSVYDLFTIEDLNYGFDKFWLRRKIKNHHSRFRMVIFQPWLLSLKKQLAKPRLISNEGVRVELFRMLYEQFYHPNFHAYLSNNRLAKKNKTKFTNLQTTQLIQQNLNRHKATLNKSENLVIPTVNKDNILRNASKFETKNKLYNITLHSTSALSKFVRKMNTRIKSAQILLKTTNLTNINKQLRLKDLQFLISPSLTKVPDFSSNFSSTKKLNISLNQINKHISNKTGLKNNNGVANIIKKKDRQILRYKTLLKRNLNSRNAPLNEFNNAKIMLHPIKFYLQKEKAFKRKWKFYGANIYRKLSIENNAPYFRVMMKRLFYYYKPTLRWNHTLKLAKNKQGHKVRRKKSRTPLRYAALQNNNLALSSSNEVLNTRKESGNNINKEAVRSNLKEPFILGIVKEKKAQQENDRSLLSAKLIGPTHNYRVVGKKASQLRAKIFKFAMQNWYYTPFNRLLLKFDIDAFIRRQPNSHFLTKNEEQELHLKRFLLAEHYDTLRWYTYMQHYRSMKTNIGGTKSFASKMYNHQFQGTFKKIRHLFAITPKTGVSDGPLFKSQISYSDPSAVILSSLSPKALKTGSESDGSSLRSLATSDRNEEKGPSFLAIRKEQNQRGVEGAKELPEQEFLVKQKFNIKPILKFDQPLYNEYSNTQKKSIINQSVMHEELLSDYKQSLLNIKKQLRPLNSETKSVDTVYTENPVNLLNNYRFAMNDLITQSTFIVKDYLKDSKEKRQGLIKNFLINNNYKELTKFYFTGQKIRGLKATTNQLSLNKQENEYLNLFKQSLPTSLSIERENKKQEGFIQAKGNKPLTSLLSKHDSFLANSSNKNFFFPSFSEIPSKQRKNNSSVSQFNTKKIEQELWFSFLKNYKKGLYDQDFLTKFLERRIKKKEKRQQKKEKELKNRLKRLKIWLAPNPLSLTFPITTKSNFSATSNRFPLLEKPYFLTTGVKKAIQDGVLHIKKEPHNSITVLDNKNNIFENEKREQTNALPNSLNSISSILIKLNNEKKLKKQNKNLINNAEMLLYTTFFKTKILSHIISVKIKTLMKLSFNTTKKKLVKPLLQKDPILTWEIKDKMLKKRKRSRKKYTKEIKKASLAKAKPTLSSSDQNPSLTGKNFLVASSLNDLKENKTLVIDQLLLGNRAASNDQQSGKSSLFSPLKIENANFAYPKSGLTLNQKKSKQTSLASSYRPIFIPSVVGEQTREEGLGKGNSEEWNKTNNNFKQLYVVPLEVKNQTKRDFNSYTLSLFKNKKNQKWLGNPTAVDTGVAKLGNSQSVTEKRKKKLSEKEVIKSSVAKFDKLNLNKKEIDFLYFNTLSGAKLGIKQKFRRKKTKNRRNQRYGRPYHRVEHPTFNANIERKSANRIPEKRLQILKEQAKLNYGLTSINSDTKAELTFPLPLLHLLQKGKRLLSFTPLRSLLRTEKGNELGVAATSNQKEKSRTKSNLVLNPKKRKSKKRTWKKYKKGINNEKLRKARKHNRDNIASQQTNILTKQMKRIKLNLKLQKWWWKQFLPNLNGTQSSTLTAESNWLLEKERQLQKTISKLSKTEILERDLINVSNSNSIKNRNPELQIGDYDFKPLAIPQALRIQLVKQPKTTTTLKENTTKQFILTTNPLPFYAGWDESLRKFVVTNRLLSRREAGYSIYEYNNKILETGTDSKQLPFNNLKNKMEFTNSPLQGMNAGTTLYCQVPFTTFDPDQLFSKGMDGFAPIGWRRFDFTHTIFKTQFLLKKTLNGESKTLNSIHGSHSNALKPLVIQKLHLKLENKIKKISFKKPSFQEFDTIKKYTNYSRRIKKHYKRIKKLQNEKVPVFLISGPLINEVLPIHYINVFNKQNRLSRDRYIKRRLRRGKKGIPKAIKEFTTKKVSEVSVALEGMTSNSQINFYNNKSDFTLRRRTKTRRKYHRKPYPAKGIEIRPRRHKFLTRFNTNYGVGAPTTLLRTPLVDVERENIGNKNLRKRPSKRKLKKNTAKLNQTRDYDGNLTTKTRQRQKIKKTGALNARLRQLRRRVSRQVLKTVPRRRPKAGGFIWPGDYLRLEQTESPKLILKNKTAETKPFQLPTLSNEQLEADKLRLPNKLQEPQMINFKENNRKEFNKQKITRKINKKALLLDLYVQPRKYLLEKHNIKVIKKKLEKAQRSNL
uniref:Hypothetical chloroplast RF1 n=1 Tax=Chlamydomonas nivalis TaxID=47906 RepID=A0A0S2ICB7_9CHLO|nr:hypothetical chloroplast RF1 [Chlamydomonas nivalis]